MSKKNKQYWQSFGDFTQSPKIAKREENEFPEMFPIANERSFFGKTTRRDFLKLMGFSTTAAVVATSCTTPVHQAIPFVNRPIENTTPGEADYFATTYVDHGEVVSILAKVRDGRPIKIEPNRLAPLHMGVTSAATQASVLDLYDTYRLPYPTKKGNELSFQNIDKEIQVALENVSGDIVLLTSPILSVTAQEVINKFKATHKNFKHITYNPISYSGLIKANKNSFGVSALPNYNFDKANVIVSFGADFLGTWISPARFAAQYAVNRKPQQNAMSKHIQFESYMSVTGANADERFMHKPSQTGLIVDALYTALKGDMINLPQNSPLHQAILRTAKILLSNKGKTLVVCGSNDSMIQTTVNAINHLLNNIGTTIDFTNSINALNAIDDDFQSLIVAMNADKVGAIILKGVNPLYTYPQSEELKKAFAKVPVRISLNPKNDETTQACTFSIPDLNYLESWGDEEPIKGTVFLTQPTIVPLFKNRSWLESLLIWSGDNTPYAEFFKNFWTKRLGGNTKYKKVLQQGFVVEKNLSAPTNVAFKGAISFNEIASNNNTTTPYEVVLYQNVAVRDGEQAPNPWLQEMPDPITKATWDNYAMVSYTFAKSVLGIDLKVPKDADYYEVKPEKPVIHIQMNTKSFDIPVLVIPGMDDHTIAIALGYGRTDKVGKASEGVGVNVYPLVDIIKNELQYYQTNLVANKTDKKYCIAQTQIHNSYEGRHSVVQEATLTAYSQEPEIFQEQHNELVKEYTKNGSFDKEATLYNTPDTKSGIHWGMAIDMNACIGCGACTISCIAENNVPVVGKREVSRFHDMHWIRVDRYFSGDIENPKVVFQPVMCQHCNQAPCENVCPVSATNHSNEGLNQMVYNRCVGTRYCANNCPYKVRRFNWQDYTGADVFPSKEKEKGIVDDVVLMMTEDLPRMVLNPDVTVRSRGVIEKCSMCTQRLQAAKLKAKSENRILLDGDAQTACMQSCPTQAISFGNILDKQSDIVKHRQDKRNYYMLEQLHVLPNVSYLAKVRNTDLEEQEK